MHLRTAAEKILSRSELAEQVESDRQLKKKIVFTNGCFDLLHAGHIRYLQEARKLGDRLIVAANTDSTIRELKGPKRPVLPEAERAFLLAALVCVDYVTLFPESTPHALLEFLKPDLLVKGGDYGVDGIIGREVVWAYGGEVKALSVVQGLSTSEIIERCKELA